MTWISLIIRECQNLPPHFHALWDSLIELSTEHIKKEDL